MSKAPKIPPGALGRGGPQKTVAVYAQEISGGAIHGNRVGDE